MNANGSNPNINSNPQQQPPSQTPQQQPNPAYGVGQVPPDHQPIPQHIDPQQYYPQQRGINRPGGLVVLL